MDTKLEGIIWWENWREKAVVTRAILRNNGSELAFDFDIDGYHYDVNIRRQGSRDRFAGSYKSHNSMRPAEVLSGPIEEGRAYFSGRDMFVLGKWKGEQAHPVFHVRLNAVDKFGEDHEDTA